MRNSLITILLGFITVACTFNKEKKQAEREGKIVLLAPEAFNKKKENYPVIDIRTPAEFAKGHLQNAININYYNRSFLEKFNEFDKSKPIFIYCRSGSRSGSATYKLVKNGFTKVYDLQGGIMYWARAKRKIVK